MKLKLREPGLPASVVLHGALLLAGIVSFSSPKPLADAQEAVAVEVIDESALRQVMRGEQQAKPQPTPTPRVDRVAEKTEQNAPGVAQRQVNAEAQPKPQEQTAREERTDVPAPAPPPPPRIVQPPPRPVEPPKSVEPPKAAAPARPAPAEKTDEEEEAEEIIRQAAKKREEQRKADEARRAEERKRQEDARRQEQARQEQARQEQARQEQQRREREQLDAKLREDERKAAEAKAAEARAADERRKADDARKAQEAARKAAEERRKREAEQEARNAATADAARRALLASREAPQNAGNTGQQVSRTPSQGAPPATGQRLNPSDRGQLVGIIADQIRACWNVPVSGKPSVLPQVRMVLNADGSLAGAPTLVNASGDPTFRAVAESGMRAIRQCAPFRIPAKFQPTFQDWRSTIVQLNPED
jgi:colicin import membrane protein